MRPNPSQDRSVLEQRWPKLDPEYQLDLNVIVSSTFINEWIKLIKFRPVCS